MESPPHQKGLFILGCPRSGTTLLQILLASQPGATSFTESHFFDFCFKLYKLAGLERALLCKNPAIRLKKFLDENHLPPDLNFANWLSSRAGFLPFQTRKAVSLFLDLMEAAADIRGAQIWIEKTPDHLLFARLIEESLRPKDDIRFVHIVRDGRDVVASLFKASKNWSYPLSLDHCVKKWNRAVQMSVELAQSPLHNLVLYENLAKDPHKEIGRLQKWLGREFNPDCIDICSRNSIDVTTPNETWKNDIYSEISAKTKFHLNLSLEQQKYVNTHLKTIPVDCLQSFQR